MYLKLSIDVNLKQILKPADKKKFPYGGVQGSRPVTPPKGPVKNKGKMWHDLVVSLDKGQP